MSNKNTKLDTNLLHKELVDKVHADRLYQIRNDAKIRAIGTAKDYNEFRLVEVRCLVVFINDEL